MEKQKQDKTNIAFTIILVVVILGIAGFYLSRSRSISTLLKKEKVIPTVIPTPMTPITEIVDNCPVNFECKLGNLGDETVCDKPKSPPILYMICKIGKGQTDAKKGVCCQKLIKSLPEDAIPVKE